MIDEPDLLRLKSWFEEYVKQFTSDDKDINANIALKKLHTGNVCVEIMDIARSLDLNFARAFEIAGNRKYLDKIRRPLPDVDVVRQVCAKAELHLNARCPARDCSAAAGVSIKKVTP